MPLTPLRSLSVLALSGLCLLGTCPVTAIELGSSVRLGLGSRVRDGGSVVATAERAPSAAFSFTPQKQGQGQEQKQQRRLQRRQQEQQQQQQQQYASQLRNNREDEDAPPDLPDLPPLPGSNTQQAQGAEEQQADSAALLEVEALRSRGMRRKHAAASSSSGSLRNGMERLRQRLQQQVSETEEQEQQEGSDINDQGGEQGDNGPVDDHVEARQEDDQDEKGEHGAGEQEEQASSDTSGEAGGDSGGGNNDPKRESMIERNEEPNDDNDDDQSHGQDDVDDQDTEDYQPKFREQARASGRRARSQSRQQRVGQQERVHERRNQKAGGQIDQAFLDEKLGNLAKGLETLLSPAALVPPASRSSLSSSPLALVTSFSQPASFTTNPVTILPAASASPFSGVTPITSVAPAEQLRLQQVATSLPLLAASNAIAAKASTAIVDPLMSFQQQQQQLQEQQQVLQQQRAQDQQQIATYAATALALKKRVGEKEMHNSLLASSGTTREPNSLYLDPSAADDLQIKMAMDNEMKQLKYDSPQFRAIPQNLPTDAEALGKASVALGLAQHRLAKMETEVKKLDSELV